MHASLHRLPGRTAGALVDLPRSGSPVVRGDTIGLPVRSDSVDAVLMLWMLYHVVDKPTALGEVARVLRPGGRLLAATNEAVEVGPHADIIGQALADIVGRAVDSWLEPLDFHVDNGEDLLAAQFDAVAVHPWIVGYELSDPGSLVDYVDSGREPIEAEVGERLPWDEVLAATERLAADHISQHGSLRFERRGAGFVAR